MENKRRLFLYYDPHPFHAHLAKLVGARFYPAPKLESRSKNFIKSTIDTVRLLLAIFTLPRDYDVYLCESTYIFPAMARKFGLLSKNAKIIDILASPLLYYITTDEIKGLRKRMAIELIKQVDGFICVGSMEMELLHKVVQTSKPIMLTYPMVSERFYHKFKTKSKMPPLNNHNLVTIGSHDTYYKGIDIIVEAFKIVRTKYPDAKLNIIGRFDTVDESLKGIDGVDFLGYVKDISGILQESSLFLQMGRGDAFPISTLEAMLFGVPAIVSEATGTKEIVSFVDKKLIIRLDAKELAKRICWYMGLPYKQKLKLSEGGIKAVKKIIFKDDKFVYEYSKFEDGILLNRGY